MRKRGHRAGWNYANCAEGIAEEAAHIVLYTCGAHYVCAGAADWAGRGCADVCQKTNATAVGGKQYAAKAVSGQTAAFCENGNSLANMPNHAVNKTFTIYH